MAVGAPGADRDRSHASVHGKACLGAEAGHAGGLGEQLGRGQQSAARQAEQGWGQAGDALAELTVQLSDLAGECADRGDLVAADAELDR